MSVVNEKASELVQLEFQNLGSNNTSTMLIQPLLEHASTYNCHLVNLHTAMGDSAIPGGEALFKVCVSPFVRRRTANNADLRALGAEVTVAIDPLTMENVFQLGQALPSSPYTAQQLLIHREMLAIFSVGAEGGPGGLMDTPEGAVDPMHRLNIHSANLVNDFGVPFVVKTPEHCVSSLDLIWSI